MIAPPSSARRSFILLMALLFGIVLVILSVVPINRAALGTRPAFAASPAAIHHAALFHIAVHVSIFAAAASLAWSAAVASSDGRTGKILALVLTLLLGCGTEYLEHAVYHQSIEFNDVFTNTLAASLTFAILALIAKYRTRPS